MVVDLTFKQLFMVFGYFFIPILVFGIFCFGGIILSNRMGGKNTLLVFFFRVLIIGMAFWGLFYYFYWLVNGVVVS